MLATKEIIGNASGPGALGFAGFAIAHVQFLVQLSSLSMLFVQHTAALEPPGRIACSLLHQSS